MPTRSTDRRELVEIAVRMTDPAWRRDLPSAALLARRAARAALAAALPAPLRRKAAELTLVLTGDAVMRGLNHQYRGIDRPTNVLSFGGPEEWRSGAPGTPIMLGDVILARETVAAEARTQGKTMADHTRHLIVHGVLHLLGHDHERTADAARMEALEIAVLADLGVGDPYRLPARAAAQAAEPERRP
jgi:probable rRNA maturation factor